MPTTFVNPYNGNEEDTCSVSFGSMAGGASVGDRQSEAQFHKAKFLGEYGVIKAKHAKGQIPDGTKVLTFDSNNFQGYVYVKNGKLMLVRYGKTTGKKNELEWDEDVSDTYLNATTYKWAIPKAVQPKNVPQASLVQVLTGWMPEKKATDAYFSKLTTIGPKLPEGTVVAENDYYQARMIWDQSKFIVQGQTNDGDWENIERGYDAADAASVFDEGWKTPKADDATVPEPPTPAAAPAGKIMTKSHAKSIQQKEGLKEGEILAVAKSSSGDTMYRIVMGKDGAAEPFLVMAQAPGTTGWKQIDKGDWMPDLVDDGNLWHFPAKDDDPVAAPTPKPPVGQNSTSTGSMSDEDVAAMFVKVKDELATSKGINIKGSNPELDAEVHKAIGDQVGYTAAEVKAKIDAYKASGKKLSALKKKVLKQTGKPKAKPTPVVPTVLPDPVHSGDSATSLPGGTPTVTVTPAASTSKSPFQILDDTGENGDGYAAPGLWGKFGAAGVMIRNVDANGVERFLMVKRGPMVSSNKGKWQLAGGAINSKETPEQGAAREIWEEIGAPKEYLDSMTKVGTHAVEVPIPGKKPWVYSNIAADAPTMFEPKVDGTETGDAQWLTKDEIKALIDDDKMHPAVKTALPSVFGLWDDKPTEANKTTVNNVTEAVAQQVDTNPNVVHSNEDVAAAYIMAKDKIVAESNGKWTLYTKNDELDLEIAIQVGLKTGLNPKQQKHAIAIYLSDPKNKLSKLKKSLIKQGKMKAEADTLKKKPTPAAVVADIDANAATGYTPGHTSVPPAAVPTAAFEPMPKPEDLTYTGQTLGTHAAQVWKDGTGQKWLFKPQQGFLTEVDVATSKLAKKLKHPAADTYKFTLNGKEGSLQRMFSGGQAFPSGLTLTNADSIGSQKVLALQKEQVLDWLFSQHDSHSANFVLDDDGNMVGIDKGQAFKFFGADKLNDSYHPNSFEKAPVYNFIWKAWQAGKPVPVNDPTADGELKDFIAKVQAIPDDELKELFRGYFEKAKAQGLFHGSVEAKLVSLVQRKKDLDKDFKRLYDDAKKERDKAVAPATASTPDPITANPGDISHISEADKAAFGLKYPQGVPYATASPEQLYTHLENTITELGNHVDPDWKKLGKLTILQAARILDENKAKKKNAPNDNLAEKKLVAWLTSPEGKAHIQSAKDKAEAIAKVAKMKANQPDLPPDSALFKDIELDEVRKWHSEQTPWTTDQEAALKHYTSNQGFNEMNGNLRGKGYVNDRVDKLVHHARAGMRPLDRPIITHRGTTAISFGLADNGSENELLYGLVGTKHRQVGFSSASYGAKAGFGSKPVIIHFECPAGTPAAFVRDISYYKHSTENEVLLDHDLEVRILKVWETGTGWSKQFHVQVRVEGWDIQS